MTQAFAIKAAIEIVVDSRRKSADVTALWRKLDRIATYLNAQLAAELINW